MEHHESFLGPSHGNIIWICLQKRLIQVLNLQHVCNNPAPLCLLKATVAVRLRYISLLIAVVNRLFTNTYKREVRTVDPKVEKI